MKRIETTLEHRLLLPGRPGAAPHPSILLLHGRGADEEDLLNLAPSFDDRFLLLSARAPFPFPYGGYTWYEVRDAGDPEPVTFLDSYGRLSRFLDDLLAHYPVDPGRLLLFGFSMGTVMSYALALSRPEKIAGVAANSGYLPVVSALTYRWQELSTIEFFITHGTEDNIIPIAQARRARMLLESAGARVRYREYAMPHSIGEQALADVAAWTRTLLL